MRKTLFILGGLIGLGTVVFVLHKKGVFSKKEIDTNTGTPNTTPTTTQKDTGFPLKKGSSSSYVTILQRVLNASIKDVGGQITANGKTYKSLTTDGIFGDNTYNVAKYFLDVNLDTVGISFEYLTKLQNSFKIY